MESQWYKDWLEQRDREVYRPPPVLAWILTWVILVGWPFWAIPLLIWLIGARG